MEASFAAAVRDTDRLCEDLGPSGRRRLLFLLRALNDAKTGDALSLAAEMENFVSGASPDGADGAGSTARRAVTPDAPGASESCMPATHEGQSPAPAETLAVTDPTALCGGVPRQEFLDSLSAGATNRQLAEKFGLTLRQANGLRIGLARRKSPTPHSAPSPTRNGHVEQLEQEPLASQRAVSPEVIEDMVRFLRQTGDIVVRSGEYYLINSRHTLTVMELVERANRKRLAQGRPAFVESALYEVSSPSHASGSGALA